MDWNFVQGIFLFFPAASPDKQKNRSVTKIMAIPESYKYRNIPVALY
ncbi:MAG: hypothetical protein IIW41_03805 [Selenomonadaceae bacterium]|nr:hypothetical protein [Selenomonadaceae bacterium]